MPSFEDLPFDTLVYLFSSFLEYDELHRAGCSSKTLKKVSNVADSACWSRYEASWGGKEVFAQTAQCLAVTSTDRKSIFTALKGKSQFEVEIPEGDISDHLSRCLQSNNFYYHSFALSFVTKRGMPPHGIDPPQTLQLLQEEFQMAHLNQKLVENLEIVDFTSVAQYQLKEIVNCSSRPYPLENQLHDYVHGLAGLLGPIAQDINIDNETDLGTAKLQLEAIACRQDVTWFFIERECCCMSGERCYGYGMIDFFLGLIRPDRHTIIYCMISDSD